MHEVQKKLLQLSKKENLAKLSLRETADKIGMSGESPQKIKHHLLQLQKKGFLHMDRSKGKMKRVGLEPDKSEGVVRGKDSQLFSIPVVGTADCGEADIFAEENYESILRVSSKLINRSSPSGLYAIKADGSSMNRAKISGKKLEDGDYALIDKEVKDPEPGSVVLAIIDNRATIKRYIKDEANEQIVLQADSSYDYEPIYLHPGDNFSISGEVIDIVKKPKRFVGGKYTA